MGRFGSNYGPNYSRTSQVTGKFGPNYGSNYDIQSPQSGCFTINYGSNYDTCAVVPPGTIEVGLISGICTVTQTLSGISEVCTKLE